LKFIEYLTAIYYLFYLIPVAIHLFSFKQKILFN